MDLVIAQIASAERQKARFHLDRLLIDWRKELWPDRNKDPIFWEDHAVQVRARLSRFSREDLLLVDFAGRHYNAYGLI
jgi:hypothetical protein